MKKDVLLQQLCSDRLNEIKKYLYSPTHNGIWKLNIEWTQDNEFHSMIERITSPVVQKIEQSQDKFIVLEIGKRKIRCESQRVLTELSWIPIKLTPLYFIFYNAAVEDLELECEFIPGQMHQPTAIEYVYEQVVDVFRNELDSTFSEPFKVFKEEIFNDGFTPKIHQNQLNKVSTGYYHLVSPPSDDNQFVTHSLSRAPLETLKKFFVSLGVAKEATISMVFSPEEEVFSDYSTYMKFSKNILFKQSNINTLFERAINHCDEENFLESVSNIGLVCEDLLTQIYETLFREPVLKGLTIGQLNDTINDKVQALYPGKKVATQPEIKPLYEDIKEALNKEVTNPEDSLIVMRQILTFIADNNKFIDGKIDSTTKKIKTKTIYPQDISEAISELLKYRNAASHRSKVPIGSYEAIRSLHCSVKFYLWWEQEKTQFDWEQEKDQIIKDMVARYEK